MPETALAANSNSTGKHQEIPLPRRREPLASPAVKRNFSILVAAIALILGISLPILTTLFALLIPSNFIPSSYRSAVRILVPPPPADFDREMETLQSVPLLSQLATNRSLPARFAKRQGAAEPLSVDLAVAFLKRDLEVVPYRKVRIIEAGVYWEDAAGAAEIANELARLYIAASIGTNQTQSTTSPQILEAATPSGRPARPNRAKAVVSSLIVGLAMAVSGGLLLYYTSRRKGPPLDPSPEGFHERG